MKKSVALAAAAAGLLTGCHEHYDEHDDEVIYPGGAWYIQYENGHPLAASTSDPTILAHEDALLVLVNEHRVAIGIPALIDDPAMRDVARAHSIHMQMGHFTSTVNPEGETPGERADIAGLSWSAYAENISYGHSSAGHVLDEWLDSPWEHDPIDDEDFTHAGVGYEHESESYWDDYWTMDFRRP